MNLNGMYQNYNLILGHGECMKIKRMEFSEYQDLVSYVNSDVSIRQNIQPKKFEVVENSKMWKIPINKIRDMYKWKSVKNNAETLLVSDIVYAGFFRPLHAFKIENYTDPKGVFYKEAYVYKNMLPSLILEKKQIDFSNSHIAFLVKYLFQTLALNINDLTEIVFAEHYRGLNEIQAENVFTKIKEFKDNNLPVYTPIYLFKYDQNYQANEEAFALMKLNFPGKAIQMTIHPYQLALSVSKNWGYARDNSTITLIDYFKKTANASLRQKW